jgi:hypothetical protein
MKEKITLSQLRKDEKYRKMSLKKLEHIINWNISHGDYNTLEGEYAIDKAHNLLSKWTKKIIVKR